MPPSEKIEQTDQASHPSQQDYSRTQELLMQSSRAIRVLPSSAADNSEDTALPKVDITDHQTDNHSKVIELSSANYKEITAKPYVPVVISTYYPEDKDPVNDAAGKTESEWTQREKSLIEQLSAEFGDKVRFMRLAIDDPLVSELEMPSSPALLIVETGADGTAVKNPQLAIGEQSKEQMDKIIDEYLDAPSKQS